MRLNFFLSLCLCRCLCLSVSLSLCLDLSVSLSLSLSLCLSLSLSLSLCLSLSVSVSPSLSLSLSLSLLHSSPPLSLPSSLYIISLRKCCMDWFGSLSPSTVGHPPCQQCDIWCSYSCASYTSQERSVTHCEKIYIYINIYMFIYVFVCVCIYIYIYIYHQYIKYIKFHLLV